MFLDWLYSTVEWTHWGWNAVTISFMVTIFFDLLVGWSLVKQFKTIGRLHSNESVSTLFFANMCCGFIVFLCYGIATDSLGATLNGMLGFFPLAVLLRLRKYTRFTSFDKLLLCSVPVVVFCLIITSHREALMTTYFAGGFIPRIHQAHVMRRNRSVGAIEPCLLLVFIVSSTFWTVYAFAIGDVVLKIINPIGLFIQFVTIALWLVYRERPITGTLVNGSFSFLVY